MHQFQTAEFQRVLISVLRGVGHGAADLDEVLTTIDAVVDGDADSWLCAWTTTAGAAWAAARVADAAGQRVTALAGYLRAGTYYAAALPIVGASSEPECELALWRRQRDCWDEAAALLGGLRITIPYLDTALPGYFFPAERDEVRPLLIINNGGSGGTAMCWSLGGAAAADRGYHWMTFDGPGQQAALYLQGLCLRPDWEAVLTPVLNAMLARPDVDARRVAVLGTGQAGLWVARALAFEHRAAVAVVDPGLTDLVTEWTGRLPRRLQAAWARGDEDAFDREMHVVEAFAPHATAALRFHGAPHGQHERSRHALFQRVAAHRLGDEVARVTTPLLITARGADDHWPGQARALYDRLPGRRSLLELPAGAAARESRIFAWLEPHLS